MSTKGKRVTASMKRKQEEVEKMRALDEKRRRFNFQVVRLFTTVKLLLLKRSDCCMSSVSYPQSWYCRG